MTNSPIVGHHYQIRHGLLLESFTGISELGETVEPSSGVYYVAPMGQRWLVMAHRHGDVGEEIDHIQFWEDYICRRLAGHWATKVHYSFNKLTKLLREHPHGVPRGRVVGHGPQYAVFHGADIPKAWGVNRGQIEVIFGIKKKANWLNDDHEHCLMADKVALREILSLEEDWDAV